MGPEPFLEGASTRAPPAPGSRPSSSSCSRATGSSRRWCRESSSRRRPSRDYIFEKSKLFAYLNLEDNELLIYEKLFALLSESVPRPELVVYLQAPTEVLLKRIRARERPEETRLSEEYLAEVNRAYNHYFFHYTQTPLLVVNTSDIDLANRPADVDDLVRQIQGMGKGTQYYVPRGRS